MICRDTNHLIRSLIPDSNESVATLAWLSQEMPLSMSSVAWYEFLGGCTLEEEQIAKCILTGGILAFADPEAQEAARLYREVGKSRKLRVDAMIAATALVRGAPLATNNLKDFEKFEPMELKLSK